MNEKGRMLKKYLFFHPKNFFLGVKNRKMSEGQICYNISVDFRMQGDMPCGHNSQHVNAERKSRYEDYDQRKEYDGLRRASDHGCEKAGEAG